MRHFHYRKRIFCFSKTSTVSTEWKTVNTRRENESMLVGAVSFCLSQTAEMNSCERTPSTGLWPSWKWATFPTPFLENVFVHVLSLLAWLLCSHLLTYLPFLPISKMYLLQIFLPQWDFDTQKGKGVEQMITELMLTLTESRTAPFRQPIALVCKGNYWLPSLTRITRNPCPSSKDLPNFQSCLNLAF